MSNHASTSSLRITTPKKPNITSPWRIKQSNQNNNIINDLSSVVDFPTVEERVAESLEVWAKELRALFDHAKERFGDVTWESEDDPSGSSRVWGHKAVIYARAPKAFKDRYFISRPFSRSPASLRSPSPSFHPPFSSGQSSPHSSTANSIRRPNPSPHPSSAARGSSLSVNTIRSEGTIRANGDAVLRLTHGDTPELFTAQLEWLYTGEGFGDVVEWISAEDDSGIGGSIRDSLGRRGNVTERRDKLGQDLTYMWRSKLYADARIHLAPPLPNQEESSSEDSEDSTDSLSSTAIFTAHRFILASRSPYFASVLLNGSHFRPHTADIHLPTPPFSPAALHFCLGYIYAGHLDFSNRTFDLVTAFAIHKAAAYLQLDTLIAEIESRIAHDFCHNFDFTKVHCRRCPTRIARVWRFASSPDVGAIILRSKSRAYIVKRWGESWSRDVATADPAERQALVDEVLKSIGPHNVVAAFRSLEMIKSKIESGIRVKGRASTVWVDPLEDMVHVIQSHARAILIDNFATIAEGAELWSLVSGKGFNHDLLEVVCSALVESVGTAQECVEGPRIYQALVSSILLRVDPNTLQTALAPRSKGRIQIEDAKEGVLGHIRRRWMQVRDGGGFDGLENWSLKEISDEIEISIDELLTGQVYTPAKVPRIMPTTGGRLPLPRPSRATLPVPSPSDGKSVRSISTRSQASTIPRPSGLRQTNAVTPDKSGLRSLRLSSSASTSSANSTPSIPRREPTISVSGPQARSPTAERQGRTVSVGSAARRAIQVSSPSGSPSSSPRGIPKPMSGPPRQLVTRAAANLKPRDSDTKSLAPSLASVRTARTAKSATTLKQTPTNSPSKVGMNGKSPAKPKTTSTTPTPRTPRKSTEETPRPRTLSTASTASTRSKAVQKDNEPPPLPSQPGPSAPVPKIHAPSINPSVRGKVPTPSLAPSIRSTAASIRSTAPSVRTLAASIDSRARAPSIASTRTLTKPGIPPKSPTRLPQPINRASPVQPLKPNGKATERLRTASQKSTASTRSQPPSARGANLAPALPIGVSRSTARSASSSTDGTEARTPRLSETLMPAIEPLIRRDGSDSSDLAAAGPSSTTSSPTKLPTRTNLPTFKTSNASPSKQSIKSPSASIHSPQSTNLPPPVSITTGRPGRKISTSSVNSSNSYRAHPASAFDPPKRPLIVRLPKKDTPVGTIPFSDKGVALHIGIPCIVSLKAKRARFRALVKYIGYMNGSRGPWLGIETEDLDRFGVSTLAAGSQNGSHYFHLSDPDPLAEADLDARLNRQRRIEVIRESLGKPIGLGLGLGGGRVPGLPIAGPYGLNVDRGAGAKRSKSPTPFTDPYGMGAGEVGGGRVLFVRPSEVVFVLGAD